MQLSDEQIDVAFDKVFPPHIKIAYLVKMIY